MADGTMFNATWNNSVAYCWVVEATLITTCQCQCNLWLTFLLMFLRQEWIVVVGSCGSSEANI